MKVSGPRRPSLVEAWRADLAARRADGASKAALEQRIALSGLNTEERSVLSLWLLAQPEDPRTSVRSQRRTVSVGLWRGSTRLARAVLRARRS